MIIGYRRVHACHIGEEAIDQYQAHVYIATPWSVRTKKKYPLSEQASALLQMLCMQSDLDSCPGVYEVDTLSETGPRQGVVVQPALL